MNVKERRKRKRLLPDCPGTKKRHFFFISYLAYEKKMQGGGKECWRRGWEITGRSAKKRNCLVGNLPEGLKLEEFLKEKS